MIWVDLVFTSSYSSPSPFHPPARHLLLPLPLPSVVVLREGLINLFFPPARLHPQPPPPHLSPPLGIHVCIEAGEGGKCYSRGRSDLHHSEADLQSPREIRSDSGGGRGGSGGGGGGGGRGSVKARSVNHLHATPLSVTLFAAGNTTFGGPNGREITAR